MIKSLLIALICLEALNANSAFDKLEARQSHLLINRFQRDTVVLVHDRLCRASKQFVQNFPAFREDLNLHFPQLVVHTVDSLTAEKVFKDLAFYDYPALVLVRRKIAIKYPADGQVVEIAQFVQFLKEVYATKPKVASVNRDIDSLSSSVSSIFFYDTEESDKVGKLLEVLKAKYLKKMEVTQLSKRDNLDKLASGLNFTLPKSASFFSFRVVDQSFEAFRGKLTAREIEAHVRRRLFPPYVTLNFNTVAYFVNKAFPKMLIYFYHQYQMHDEASQAFEAGIVPEKLKSRYQVFLADLGLKINKFIFEENGFKRSPVLVLFDVGEEGVEKKFIFSHKEIDPILVSNFLDQNESNLLPRYFKSELKDFDAKDRNTLVGSRVTRRW